MAEHPRSSIYPAGPALPVVSIKALHPTSHSDTPTFPRDGKSPSLCTNICGRGFMSRATSGFIPLTGQFTSTRHVLSPALPICIAQWQGQRASREKRQYSTRGWPTFIWTSSHRTGPTSLYSHPSWYQVASCQLIILSSIAIQHLAFNYATSSPHPPPGNPGPMAAGWQQHTASYRIVKSGEQRTEGHWTEGEEANSRYYALFWSSVETRPCVQGNLGKFDSPKGARIN